LLSAVGLAAFGENDELLFFKPFSENPSEAASVIQTGEAPEQYVKEFINALRGRGVEKLLFWDDRIPLFLQRGGVDASVQLVKVEPRVIDVESSLKGEELERYRSLVRAVSVEVAKRRIMVEAGRRDLHIVHAVRVFDDLEKMKNQVFVRVREWYDIHFPELHEIVEDLDTYLKLVSIPLLRQKLDLEKVRDLLGEDKVRKVVEAAEKSVGGPIDEKDASLVAMFSTLGLEISRMTEKTAQYIRELMSVEAPNVSAVAGPVLGSRLISLAGGLEKLARLPASTIQVLGAEKALFRFFRTGRGAPKHGIIFQHPLVHSAPRWQRGKIARVLAAKISIAARIDYFSKEDRGNELREALEKRVEEIRRKYSSPPKKELEKVRRKRRERR